MSRAAPHARLPAFLVSGCMAAVLGAFLLHTAVSAAAFAPLKEASTTEDSGWVINEVHADPADDLAGDANGDGLRDAQQDEFIELINNSGGAADISGWTLSDAQELRHVFPEGTTVPDQCAIVIFGGGVLTGSFGSAEVQTASSGGLALNNSGDTVTLSDGLTTIESMSYVLEGDEEQSLARSPDISGVWQLHLLASDPLNSRFSPGTRVDGTVFQGCPAYDAPPVVLETQPADGASAVAIDAVIAIDFSEPVTLGESWYEIACTQSGSHTASRSGAEDVVILTPETPFAYDESCLVTLFGAAINDPGGQIMGADAQWQFTTEAETNPDNPPGISGSSPADGAEGVSLSVTPVITFSEPVNLLTTAVGLTCGSSGQVPLLLSGGPLRYYADPQIDLGRGEQCTLAVDKGGVSDLDANDPPDQLADDWQARFSIETADFVLINEVDANSAGVDDAEFIELFDGGRGGTQLDGLSIVLFSGHDDSVYATFDLAGEQTDAHGYFLLASEGVAGVDLTMDDTRLQNGPDAVALYQTAASGMPPGTAVTTQRLLDALVYGSAPVDEGLLPLLLAGETQVDEDGRDLDDFHSLQRCPNGAGGQRTTAAYWPDWPTPKEANRCVRDDPPRISATTPADGAANVPLDGALTLTFSEETAVHGAWFEISCERSGGHAALFSGNGRQYTLQPAEPFAFAEQCQVTLFAESISDLDANDPPDHPAADYVWSFTTEPAGHVLINEVDADTAGLDTAEFIELYDGGQGGTPLDGLLLVLYNGTDDLSYRTINLDGWQTDEAGWFVIGSKGAANVDLALPDSVIQNGADAAALYAANGESITNGSAVRLDNLLDAVVYGTADDPDAVLLALLVPGEQQLDEDSRKAKDVDSNQRCPDGGGGQRRSASFVQNLATPGEANKCIYDAAPELLHTTPELDEEAVAVDTPITITFSEAVTLEDGWFSFVCEKAGVPELSIRHSGDQVVLKPQRDLVQGDACTLAVFSEHVRDSDADDPPDKMTADFTLRFHTAAPLAADFVLINELDADTPGMDKAEFIELYDGGAGGTALDGLVVVLFNGSGDRSYAAFDLDGYRTDGAGYFLLGNSAVPSVDLVFANGRLQNGPDAAALYAADAADFPAGTAVATGDLLDALVYGSGVDSAPGLLPLLLGGEGVVDEDGRDARELHANQRCPNGTGGQRRSSAYLPNTPTPKSANFCVVDSAPRVSAHQPLDGARNVALDAGISVNFDEAVSLHSDGIHLQCSSSGSHAVAIAGGPVSFSIRPDGRLSPQELCTITVSGSAVSDRDDNDPPDQMSGDYSWSFETAAHPAARHLLINELDADTPGADKAEFIELYDGGEGGTALDGLELVFFNGADDRVYRRIDLTGYQTDIDGYFVAGSSAVSGVDLVIANGAIQNGPDAAALYVRAESDFDDPGRPGQQGLLDALVYHTNDEADPGLDFLLLADEPQVNEGQWHDPAVDSNQRCPNGEGGQRVSSGYIQNPPTPGAANNCTVDKPPTVLSVFPAEGAVDVPLDSRLVVHFDEPVQTGDTWIKLSCGRQGDIELTTSGGPELFTVEAGALAPFDTCTAEIAGSKVYDLDGHADRLGDDFSWQFSTGKPLTNVSAGFTSSSPTWIGTPVQFTNVSQGSKPLTYTWDFGDGTPLDDGENPQHSYTRVGRYIVTLTVETVWGETAVTSAPVEILPVRVYVPVYVLP